MQSQLYAFRMRIFSLKQKNIISRNLFLRRCEDVIEAVGKVNENVRSWWSFMRCIAGTVASNGKLFHIFPLERWSEIGSRRNFHWERGRRAFLCATSLSAARKVVSSSFNYLIMGTFSLKLARNCDEVDKVSSGLSFGSSASHDNRTNRLPQKELSTGFPANLSGRA